MLGVVWRNFLIEFARTFPMQILDISHLDFPQAEKQFFDLVDNLENIEMTILF